MKTWRQMDESEQTELVLSGAEMCVRCGGHGTITIMGLTGEKECYMCEGLGYLSELPPAATASRAIYEWCKEHGNERYSYSS